MSLRTAISQAFRTLSNPDKEFKDINKRTLEKVLEDYILILLASGLLAGIASFIYIVGSASFLKLFRGVSVNYWRLINYSAGISGSIFFFYLFAGTFLFFLISLIIRLFVRRVKYTKLIAIMCYSISPVLLFGWISSKIVLPLSIWSLFLLIIGIKQSHLEASEQLIKKNKSLKKRGIQKKRE